MTQLFANNAKTTLNGAIVSSSATSIVVTSGATLPSPTGGDFFKLTLTQATGTESLWEIVCIVGRSTNTLTVGIPGSAAADAAGRGYDSTSATTWADLSKAECRLSANDMRPRASQCIHENSTTVNENYTLQVGSNGFSVGPVTVSGGVAVTVPSGQRWAVL